MPPDADGRGQYFGEIAMDGPGWQRLLSRLGMQAVAAH